jgi:CheY-like chemotaxis protein
MAKLLLLDDEPQTLEWMTAALTTVGHEVRGYLSGRDALAALTRWRPDLIVADVVMPEIDGVTFARLVRAHGGPPTLFISIALKETDAVLAGAVGYVRKPATADEVRTAVSRVLGDHRQRPTILVVEDEADVRELLRDYLEATFGVAEADDGRSALDVLRRNHIDLVITDFHMPNMNGLELIRAIRSDPALERTPVILETSDSAVLNAPVWNELNVTYRVSKADFIRWLARRIAAALGAKSASQVELR